jgi:hypothetical protein
MRMINTFLIFLSSCAMAQTLFVPLTPCRVVDTRSPSQYPAGNGGQLAARKTRTFKIISSSCGLPTDGSAVAYSFNLTAVPAGGPLTSVMLWPTGVAMPNASTLNDSIGMNLANAALVPSGTGGSVNIYASNATDIMLDVDGYFVATPVQPTFMTDSFSGGAGTFTLSYSPSSPPQVFVNGVRQVGPNYTISGKSLTFAVGSVPQVADSIVVDYWHR